MGITHENMLTVPSATRQQNPAIKNVQAQRKGRAASNRYGRQTRVICVRSAPQTHLQGRKVRDLAKTPEA